MTTSHIEHSHILSFAEDNVNLHRDIARPYREQVNRLREQLVAHIAENPGFGLVKMLLSGSLAKGSALRTINDIDVAVYLAADSAPEEKDQMIPWLYDRLRETYPTLENNQFRLQEYSVRVSFRGTDLDVECVPVYYEGDPDDKGYLFSRDTGNRVLTSIPLHLEFIRKRKNRQDIHFIQVVRLLKWWVREQKARNEDFHFKSFMIELICSHLLDTGQDYSDYPSAMSSFFSYILTDEFESRIAFTDYYSSSSLPSSRHDLIEIFDPVTPDNNVADSYDTADKDNIYRAAKEAVEAITQAEWAPTKVVAIEAWQRVLGPTFRG